LLSPEQIDPIGKGVAMEDGFKVPGQKIGTAGVTRLNKIAGGKVRISAIFPLFLDHRRSFDMVLIHCAGGLFGPLAEDSSAASF